MGFTGLVPDGSLHLLPWGALQNESGTYLAQQAVVSVAPSATVLWTLTREPEVQTAKLFLGVAFSETGHETGGTAKSRGLSEIRGADIKPLQFSKEEVLDLPPRLRQTDKTLLAVRRKGIDRQDKITAYSEAAGEAEAGNA
ncbi:MAG: CHAT domain-containing protein, partial [Acidobacteriota bacterium]|nr:CHAT domain-containing protein [Acidobacteriota bacterium]